MNKTEELADALRSWAKEWSMFLEFDGKVIPGHCRNEDIYRLLNRLDESLSRIDFSEGEW